MKIKINTTKPYSIIEYFEGNIKKDISKDENEASIETICFEVKDWGGDVEVCWLDEYTHDDRTDVEDKIIAQYLEQRKNKYI